MNPSTRDDSHALCLRFLQAISEEEVVDILQERGYWDDRSAWRPYGNIGNNRGVVGAQQSSAVAALVEKLVNSVDAVLVSECRRLGLDPVGPSAPQSMQEAVAQLFGVHAGKVETLDPTTRTELADHIRLVAYGTKTEPCYLIIDRGEGQSPLTFPETFLSLLRENKAGIPFVQGKYNMGATGVLQFAGKHSFQLILSRRQPHLANAAEDQLWGFTLIRRFDPLPDQPFTSYVYLAPQGAILSFDAESMNVLPGRYPEAFVNALEAGTCIKIWNYRLPGRLKSLATLDLRYALERHLQGPALPIRIQERRQGYRAHYYDTTMSGLFALLADNQDKIEPGFDTGGDLDVPGVGSVHLRLVVMKEDLSKDRRYPSGVFFNVNGQLHGELAGTLITRRTKLDYLADSLTVMVDCTDLPQRVREDLFMADRERMRQIQERDALEGAIVSYLQEHPGLKELNARRRQERVASASKEETINVVQQLLRSDPTLAALFGRGKELKIPVGPLPEPARFDGKKYPTYFRLEKEPAGGLRKPCPRNRSCRVAFETDAANDYFSRSNDPGRLVVRGMARVASIHLWNGRAILSLSIPPEANVGDVLTVHTEVIDSSRPLPLESSFAIEVLPEAEPMPPGPKPRPPGAEGSAIPNVVEVYRDEWAKHGFSERSAISLKQGDDDGLDLFVNMDNIYLRNEIARRRKLDPIVVRYWFKWGITLLVVGLLYDRAATRDESDEPGAENEYSEIELVARGLAVTVIPVILQLSRGPAAVEA
jgi:hypothetical protein